MGKSVRKEYAARIGELRRLGHELRTPLTVIQGYASLLEDDELASDNRRDACMLLRQKCAEMNRIISTFLDDASDQVQLPVESQVAGLQAAR